MLKEYNAEEMKVTNIFWRYIKKKITQRLKNFFKYLKGILWAQIGLIYVILLAINYTGNL